MGRGLGPRLSFRQALPFPFTAETCCLPTFALPFPSSSQQCPQSYLWSLRP